MTIHLFEKYSSNQYKLEKKITLNGNYAGLQLAPHYN